MGSGYGRGGTRPYRLNESFRLLYSCAFVSIRGCPDRVLGRFPAYFHSWNGKRGNGFQEAA